jgi:hypothetical protein
VESIRVHIIGKAGCHLCDDAEVVVTSVAAKYRNVVVEHSVLDDDAEWAVLYADKIPVIHIDGDEVAYWRISATTLAHELDTRGGIPVTGNTEYK